MKYKVLSPIKTGPKPDDVLSLGDVIDLAPKEAAALIACGAVEDPKAKAKSDDTQA